METVRRTAWDPDTEQEYEIELPVDSVVEEALLKLNYPPDGLHKKEIAEKLAEQFSLTDEQKNAKYRNATRIFNNFVGRVTTDLVKSGKLERPKRSRVIKSKHENDPTMQTEENFEDIRDSSEESIEQIISKLEENWLRTCCRKLSTIHLLFLKNSLLTCLLQWVMVVHEKMPKR